MAETEGYASFLARWAERKRAARQGVPLTADPPRESAVGPAEAPPARDADGRIAAAESATHAVPDLAPSPLPDPVSAPMLTDADMPALDRLDGHSDYSGFLSRGVSTPLRRQALAQLFHSPHLNVTDSLDDFAEDYTRFEAMGDLVTADMRHQLELAAQGLTGQARQPVVQVWEEKGPPGQADHGAAAARQAGPSSAVQDHAPTEASVPDAAPEPHAGGLARAGQT